MDYKPHYYYNGEYQPVGKWRCGIEEIRIICGSNVKKSVVVEYFSIWKKGKYVNGKV